MSHVEYINDPSKGACDHEWMPTNDFNDRCPRCGAERRKEHRCEPPGGRPNDNHWTCGECGQEWAAIVSGWRWYYDGGREDDDCNCRRPFARPEDDEWTCDECGQVWLAETVPGSWHWERG